MKHRAKNKDGIKKGAKAPFFMYSETFHKAIYAEDSNFMLYSLNFAL